MTIKFIIIGKNKLTLFQVAEKEYTKRLSVFSKLQNIIIPSQPGSSQQEIIRQENQKILAKLKKDDFVIVLDQNGKNLDSSQLATKLESWQQKTSSLTFIIGGTFGLADQTKKRANFTLSLSSLTFTHEMARIILLEQIYRAFTIINNKPYHY